MASRPSLLDQIIRFMVWSAVIGALAGPVLLVALFNTGIIIQFPFLRDNDNGFIQTVRTLTAPSPSSRIVSNDSAERLKQIERLRSLTARPEMASGSAMRLTLLAIGFDNEKPEPTPPGSKSNGVDADGYRRLSLDLSGLPKDAVVLIADQPIRWSVTGASGSWGRIGFEGLAPFDIVDGRPNMIAGFRIRAFGAREATRADDPGHLNPRAQREWCAAVKLWAEHFAVTMSQVEFAVVANPTAVTARNGTIASDGTWGIVRTGGGIEDLCKHR